MGGEKKFDAVIVGGGPAGASAAVYALRGGLSVALVHNRASALLAADMIDNFYGAMPVSGAALYDKGIADAARLGAELVEAQVTYACAEADGFKVSTDRGELSSRFLVVATGAARKKPTLPGLGELEGKGVSYCAVCDGFFYRKKRVGVLGAGEFAAHEYAALSGLCSEVVLLTDGEQPSFEAQADTRKLSCVIERGGRFAGVRFEDGSERELDGLFVAVGVAGSGELARALGAVTDRAGNIVVDADGATNVPGLFAAGDCTAGVKQIARAVNDGMNVGLSLVRSKREKNA